MSAALVIGAGAGLGSYSRLHATPEVSLAVAVVVALAVLVGRLLFGVGYGAVYVIEVIDPHDGTPVCGYVGKTRQRPASKRIDQHLQGSHYYGTPAQPWADTVTRWWLANEGRWVTDVGLHLREFTNIRARRPLYNHTMNLGNSRRIPKALAVQQREERDDYRIADYAA